MNIKWKVEVPQWILLAAMFGAALAAWPNAPNRIPVHWGLAGQPDRFGGRFEGLLLLPLVALGLYVLMLVLPRIDPGRANYGRFPGAYAAIRIGVLGLLAAIHGAALAWIWHGRVNMGFLAPFAMGILTIVIGGALGKVRPNWFVGIRTPWTLSSKTSWVRTHRAGGWVFVLVGFATVASAFIGSRVAFFVLTTGLVGGSVGLVVYSYLVFRRDPDKLPPAGTLPAD